MRLTNFIQFKINDQVKKELDELFIKSGSDNQSEFWRLLITLGLDTYKEIKKIKGE